MQYAKLYRCTNLTSLKYTDTLSAFQGHGGRRFVGVSTGHSCPPPIPGPIAGYGPGETATYMSKDYA